MKFERSDLESERHETGFEMPELGSERPELLVGQILVFNDSAVFGLTAPAQML